MYSVSIHLIMNIKCFQEQRSVASYRYKKLRLLFDFLCNTGAPFTGELTAVVVSLRLLSTKLRLSALRAMTPRPVFDACDCGGLYSGKVPTTSYVHCISDVCNTCVYIVRYVSASLGLVCREQVIYRVNITMISSHTMISNISH